MSDARKLCQAALSQCDVICCEPEDEMVREALTAYLALLDEAPLPEDVAAAERVLNWELILEGITVGKFLAAKDIIFAALRAATRERDEARDKAREERQNALDAEAHIKAQRERAEAAEAEAKALRYVINELSKIAGPPCWEGDEEGPPPENDADDVCGCIGCEIGRILANAKKEHPCPDCKALRARVEAWMAETVAIIGASFHPERRRALLAILRGKGDGDEPHKD